MAERIFRARAQARGELARWRIESAGTWGVDGQPASALAQAVMAQRGVSLEGHVARTVSAELLESADVVLVMTRSHRDALTAEFPRSRSKIHLVSELNDLAFDVADPYGKPLGAYEDCADTLEQLIARGYNRAARWVNQSSAPVENV
jgi:protein-tyrosine phosphatase